MQRPPDYPSRSGLSVKETQRCEPANSIRISGVPQSAARNKRRFHDDLVRLYPSGNSDHH